VQLLFILGIAFAIIAVTFALQNNSSVTVALGFWNFDSSLAVILLFAIGLGALIAGLVSTPSMIKAQWDRALLRRQATSLEETNAVLERRMRELESQVPQPIQAPLPAAEEKPYVGLRTLLTGGDEQQAVITPQAKAS